MARDIEKIIKCRRENMNARYDMNMDDMAFLYKIAIKEGVATSESICDALIKAFTFGYEMGVRSQGKKEGRKNNV